MYTVSNPLIHILILVSLRMLLIFINNMDQKPAIMIQKSSEILLW